MPASYVVDFVRFYVSVPITYGMGSLKTSYYRFDQWCRGLSRGGYALFTMLVAFLVTLAVTRLFFDQFSLSSALGSALGLGIVYYLMDPR